MSVKIGLGIGASPFKSGQAFFRWVDLCEDAGIDSIWQSDRLVSREPYLESLSTMAALAGATERMRFGMSAVVATLRDPLLLAKQCASIDFLSDGRLLPVFGVGAEKAPEWSATGQTPRRRGRRADEILEIVRRLWTEDSVDFDGEFFQYKGAQIAPRPIQNPLPLWIGGSSAAAIERTARIGTGWLAGIQTPEEVQPVVEAIRSASLKKGRPIPEDHYGATFAYRFGTNEDPIVSALNRKRGASARPGFLVVGSDQDILDRISAYREAGISKFVLIPIAQGDEDLLEQTRRLIGEILPQAEP